MLSTLRVVREEIGGQVAVVPDGQGLILTQEAIAHQRADCRFEPGVGELRLEDLPYDRGDQFFRRAENEGGAKEEHGLHHKLRLWPSGFEPLAHLRESEQYAAWSDIVKVGAHVLADLPRQGDQLRLSEIAAGHGGKALQERSHLFVGRGLFIFVTSAASDDDLQAT